MKLTILIIAFLTFFSTAYAQKFNLDPQTDTGISFISYGKVLSVESCPGDMPCSPSSTVTVELTLSGCLDQLGLYGAKFTYDNQNKKYNLYISAINIHKKASENVRCYRAATEDIKVSVSDKIEAQDINLIMIESNLF